MERLSGLGMEWKDVTDVNVYTAAENGDWLAAELLPHMGEDAAHGIRWYLSSRPPIIGLDFEMDSSAATAASSGFRLPTQTPLGRPLIILRVAGGSCRRHRPKY